MPNLKAGEPILLQALSGSLETVVRCKVGGFQSPMKLHINYKAQNMQATDLLIFWSHTNTNPDESNHIKKLYSKPHTIVICAKDAEGRKVSKFKDQYVYISFISERGCQLEITPELTKSEHTTKHSIALPTFGEAHHDDANLKLLEKDDPYYIEYRKLARERERRLKEVIRGNIENAGNEKEPSRAKHAQLTMHHRGQAKLRNEQL